jgi:hypothetical protein
LTARIRSGGAQRGTNCGVSAYAPRETASLSTAIAHRHGAWRCEASPAAREKGTDMLLLIILIILIFGFGYGGYRMGPGWGYYGGGGVSLLLVIVVILLLLRVI